MKKSRMALVIIPALLAICAVGVAEQQWGQDPFYRGYGRDSRRGIPNWEIDRRFPEDVFTFVRVEYDSWWHHDNANQRGFGRRWGGGWGWDTDFPDSDLNFSFRLQQLTSLKVNPDPISLRLTDDALFDHPFIYMIEPGGLHFHEDEVVALRRYLLNGGFLMVDDFWGDAAYDNFYAEIKRVFPDREPTELKIDHEVFNCVYKLTEKPQIPNIGTAIDSQWTGITWESRYGPSAQFVHYKGIFDDKGRMMVIICHNTDLGDGWEREGEDSWFFENFSAPKAYPMGINIVTYAMTH
ncbi:MAG: DUF4159 domain-containing protein [Pirellulales bacterium]|nr:DUF4159 domain-containing protein [Pirellulales bacterium]